MRKKYFVFFLLVFISLSFVAASSFYLGNPSNAIATNYSKNSYLSGWLNISFNNVSSDSYFTDSLNNKIYLTDILGSQQNSGYNYSCDTDSCLSSYGVLNPQTSKSFYMNQNSTKLIGIGFEENMQNINSISFNINSNAQKSCTNQVSVDVADDGIIDYINNQESGSVCSTVYKGCSEIPGGPQDNGGTGIGIDNNSTKDINNGNADSFFKILTKLILGLINVKKIGNVITGKVVQTSDIVITETPLCQRIEFPAGPGYEIGAWIKESVSGTKQFNMEVYNINGTKIDSCQLSKANLPQGGSAYLGCNTNFYLIQPEELYVCVSTTSGTGKFLTQGYIPTGEKCGFQGIPPKTEVAAYDIYLRKKEFKTMTSGLIISNNLSAGISLADLAKEYILQNYGNLNCTDGCVVPVRISSGVNQNITINNISIIYQGTLGQTESRNLYDIEDSVAKISSKNQRLYLDGFFTLPSTSQSINYELDLNNEDILTKTINIKDMTMNINPLTASSGIPTSFSVLISPSKIVDRYFWYFGDRTNIDDTANNSITHTYLKTGNYSISVGIVSNYETIYKSSKINVVSSASNLGQIFIDKRASLAKIKTKINSLDNFSASKIKQYINLEQTESSLNELESEYNSTTNETKLSEIANELFALPIADDMIINPQSEKTVSLQRENIDTNALASAMGKEINVSDQEKLKDVILNWSATNINLKISANRFDFSVNGNTEEGFSVYKLTIENNGQDTPYFIIRDMKDFDSDKTFSKTNGFDSMKLSESENSMEIASSENLEVEQLPVMISPDISKFSSIDFTITPPKTTTKIDLKNLWIYFVIGIGILLIIFIFYFVYNKIMHREKKSKSEKLFANRTDLENLKNYIINARKNQIGNAEIVDNLKKANWNSNQIKYAMDELSGKIK